MVIEGDINAGGITTIKLSRVIAFGDEDNVHKAPSAKVSVKTEQGQTYEGKLVGSDNGTATYQIDLRAMAADSRCQLNVFCDDNSKNYYSDWITSVQAPVITEITHSLDPETDRVSLRFSFHSTGDSEYFIWTADQLWQYHVLYPSSLTFDYTYNKMFSESPNTYYCWGRYSDSKLNLTSAADIREGEEYKLDNELIGTYSRNNSRFNDIFTVTVRVQGMDEDAYEYFSNMRNSSYASGNLFSPTPSEMSGNLHCEQDPEELVYGYVSGCATAERTLVIYNAQTEYYYGTYHDDNQEKVFDAKTEWRDAWNKGYRPLRIENGHYYWAKERCMNCTLQGGTNIRPADWKY